MKLKCQNHDYRVHVLGANKVIHRSDGLLCDSTHLEMGRYVDPFSGKPGRKALYTPIEILWGDHQSRIDPDR